MVPFRRILYPTDFSELSAYAFDHAFSLATALRAELHCLHVVDDSYQYWLSFDAATVPAGPPTEELIAAAQRELDRFLLPRQVEGMEIQRHVRHGRAFVEIIRYARENGIDLIVIGTHGWSALRHVLMGSVAEKVIRKSPVPVMSVRNPKHPFEMP
jgi:nucleotide-binding universal stress UspA family protein